MVLFAIKHRSRIKVSFALIIIKSTRFCQKKVLVQNQNLKIKTLKNILLMQE
jgi:predicted transcriptional regulator